MLSNAPVSAVIPVLDINRAKKFYSEVLGLKELANPMEDPSGALFEAGLGSRLYIYQRPPSHAEHTLASFTVEDIESTMNDLRSRGVVFEEYDMPGIKTVNGVADWEGNKAAWFKDSEGNILALDQHSKNS